MGENHQPTGDGYDAWLGAALGHLEQRAATMLRPLLMLSAAELAPAERADTVLAQVVAALVTEARIEAGFAYTLGQADVFTRGRRARFD